LKNWVTFQLSDKGESVLENDPSLIEKVVRKHIKADIFLPMYYNKSRNYENRLFLFRGYIFIEFDTTEAPKYSKLAESYYFTGPLLVNRRLHLTPNSEIKKLRAKLIKMTRPTIKVGDKVKVLDGKFVNLEAVVTEYYPKEKEVDLSVKLKCMSIIVPRIPIVCLKNMSAEDKVKNTLQERILTILKEHVTGLTRKRLISLMELTDEEMKRVSTCLSRAVKRGLVSVVIIEDNKSIFVYGENNT